MGDRFEGKVALITGAGSGIGRAVTLLLLDEGASVLAVDVDAAGLEDTAGFGALAEGDGELATAIADLSDPDACVTAVHTAVGRFGRLDVLGNVAGILVAAHATDVTREQYRKLMAINLDAPFFLSQAAIPHLLQAEGNIVTMGTLELKLRDRVLKRAMDILGGLVGVLIALAWVFGGLRRRPSRL